MLSGIGRVTEIVESEMDYSTVLESVKRIADRFAKDRSNRQLRRALDRADFDQLSEAHLPLISVPVAQGGLWYSTQESVRPICQLLRVLATGDSSVALVCSMHPAVLAYWLSALALEDDAWQQQCRAIIESVKRGQWWGTITSEPGSGGDLTQSSAKASRIDGDLRYRISGQKHFGSGLGIVSKMVTTAIPEGEDVPDWFFVDVEDVPWDGSTGLRLLAPWDGHGMTATQSHAVSLEGFPATRIACPGQLLDVTARAGGLIGCLFTSVIAGVVDVAMSAAEEILRSNNIGSYESVEWTRIQMEYWLLEQALEGMLRAVETQDDPRHDVLQGKTAAAELAETILTRICRLVGGSTLSRRSPFGFWFQDVRALGFLRPPWNLAFANLRRLSDHDIATDMNE